MIPRKTIAAIGGKGYRRGARQRAGNAILVASSLDLRRSFEFRWMQLMRHESIETTLRYYVGRNAATTADALYRAIGAAACISPAAPF